MGVVLFDLDRTLFDTDQFGLRMGQILVEMTDLDLASVTEKVEVYKQRLDSNLWFDFRELAKDFAGSEEQYSNILRAFISDEQAFQVYDDVIESLGILKADGYELGIFSEGVPWFQETKLNNIEIREYLNSEIVYIARSKRTREFLDTLPERVVIVDDNPEVIEVLEEDGRFVPVWLNRKGVDWEFEREIRGLGELEPLLVGLGSLDYARDDR